MQDSYQGLGDQHAKIWDASVARSDHIPWLLRTVDIYLADCQSLWLHVH